MGLFNKLFGNETKTETKEIPIQVSLLDKLIEIDIDYTEYITLGGDEIEIDLEMELLGVVKQTFNELENDFFTSLLNVERNDNINEVYLLKSETTERDFKDFINKLYNLIGKDWKSKGEFSITDLEFIRGNNKGEIRGWEDKVSRYYIRVDRTEGKELSFSITKNKLVYIYED